MKLDRVFNMEYISNGKYNKFKLRYYDTIFNVPTYICDSIEGILILQHSDDSIMAIVTSNISNDKELIEFSVAINTIAFLTSQLDADAIAINKFGISRYTRYLDNQFIPGSDEEKKERFNNAVNSYRAYSKDAFSKIRLAISTLNKNICIN